jgi:hypothetical protein
LNINIVQKTNTLAYLSKTLLHKTMPRVPTVSKGRHFRLFF